jgi:hypothetical protein
MCDTTELSRRVQHSLSRLGYPHIEARDLGDGKIQLLGKYRTYDERAILVAAVQTVSGVRSISLKLRR